ncbi:MAG: adenosylmethionine decarboxylase [Candidatus Aminicenantes bacterium]|nr:adenosylmethionine decarboxylase [Candidatus Aminicenantes bacterium]
MAEEKHNSIGHHYIVEASGCDPKIISDVAKVQQILVKAAEISGAKVWAVSFHKFPPFGVSGVIVISESHISAHTWPEFRYGALDFYTCGDSVDPEKGLFYAVEAFGASSSHITEITRGIDEGDQAYFHSFVTWEEDFEK